MHHRRTATFLKMLWKENKWLLYLLLQYSINQKHVERNKRFSLNETMHVEFSISCILSRAVTIISLATVIYSKISNICWWML